MENSNKTVSIINDQTIDYVSILAKLELSDAEREQAKADMGRMLAYIDKLNELDTTGVEPMSHVFPTQNVFREDVAAGVEEAGECPKGAAGRNVEVGREALKNAPAQKDSMFQVPRTIV